MAEKTARNITRGREMKRRRLAAKMTAQQLGEALGMTGNTARTSIYRAESGCHRIGASRWLLMLSITEPKKERRES